MEYQQVLFNKIADLVSDRNGLTFGLGITKGAENKNADAYRIHILSDEKDGSYLRKNFLNKS